MMFPASENNLSEGTEVAGIAKYFLASRERTGNSSWCCLHQVRRHTLGCTENVAK